MIKSMKHRVGHGSCKGHRCKQSLTHTHTYINVKSLVDLQEVNVFIVPAFCFGTCTHVRVALNLWAWLTPADAGWPVRRTGVWTAPCFEQTLTAGRTYNEGETEREREIVDAGNHTSKVKNRKWMAAPPMNI